MNLKKKQLICLIVITVLALIPRFIVLFTNSQFSYGDGYDYLIVRDIIINHKFPLVGFNGLYGLHIPKGAGWYYWLGAAFTFTNGSPFGAKILTFLASLGAILTAFFALKKNFNLQTAVIVTGLVSISPWIVEQVGTIWPPYVAVLPVSLFLFALIEFLKKKQKYAFLMALSICLMFQFEVAIAAFFIFQIILLTPLALKYKYISFKNLFFSFLILFLFIILPVIIYDLSHNFYFLNGVLLLITHGSKLHGLSGSLFMQKVDSFVWNFRSTFSPNIFISIFLFVSTYIGSTFFVKDRRTDSYKKFFVIYLGTTPFLKFLFTLFYPGDVRGWHLVDLAIIYCFLTGIIFAYFLKKKSFKYFSISIIILLIVLSVSRNYKIYKNEFDFSFAKIDSLTQSSIINFIYQDAKGKKFSYFYPQDSLSVDIDYLFWWYGAKRFGYQPIKNSSTIYLIYPPNYVGKIIIVKGKILEQKLFPNGFKVEKIKANST